MDADGIADALRQAQADSLSLAADVLGSSDLDALRERESSQAAAVSGAPMPVNSDNDYVLTGMTMRVVNHEFLAHRRRYSELIRQQQLQRRVIDAATNKWLPRAQRASPYGCFTLPRFDDELQLTEHDVASIIDSATHVEKPDAIRDERNAAIRSQFMKYLLGEAAINDKGERVAPGFVANAASVKELEDMLIAEETARRQIPDIRPLRSEDVAAIEAITESIRGKIAAPVLVRYAQAVEVFDWSEVSLTSNELKDVFKAFVLNAEPRSDMELEKRRYYRETIEAAPIEAMIKSLDGKPAWIDDVENASDERKAEVTCLVYGTEVVTAESKPVADVTRRAALLQTNDERLAEFKANVEEVVRLEALIAGVSSRPDGVSAADVAELRALQEARRRSVEPTEERLRVRRFRLLSVIGGVRSEAEVQLKFLE